MIDSKGAAVLRIVILGPDGAGKSSVIDGLIDRLRLSGLATSMRHLKPKTVANLRGKKDVIVTDPHGMSARGTFLSLLKIVIWLFEEWDAVLFDSEANKLMICDRYYHDLLIDPVRYRFGAPLCLAKLVGLLMPQPGLWILLNAPPDVLQQRKQEVRPEETARQCAAYLEFIKTRQPHLIVDASRPLGSVIDEVQTAVLAVAAPGGFS